MRFSNDFSTRLPVSFSKLVKEFQQLLNDAPPRFTRSAHNQFESELREMQNLLNNENAFSNISNWARGGLVLFDGQWQEPLNVNIMDAILSSPFEALETLFGDLKYIKEEPLDVEGFETPDELEVKSENGQWVWDDDALTWRRVEGHSETSSPSPPPPPHRRPITEDEEEEFGYRRRNRKTEHPVWMFFTRTEDGAGAHCILCGLLIRSSCASNNMRHLSRHHKNEHGFIHYTWLQKMNCNPKYVKGDS